MPSVYVRGYGNPNAKVVYIGEAPGAQEEAIRRPFIGPAGKLLDSASQSAGIPPSSTFKTNICRFRPPGNNIGAWILPIKAKHIPADFVRWNPPGGGPELWVAPFIPQHVEDLFAEIAAVHPNVLVALGNTALRILTPEAGITKWRGSILSTTVAGRTYKLIPTLHPAMILREYTSLPDLIRDLSRAQAESAFPEDRVPERELIVRPSEKQVMETVDEIEAHSKADPKYFITVDIETRRRQIACAGIGLSKAKAICIPFMDVERPEGYWPATTERSIIQRLRHLLTTVPISNQNYLYDAYYFAVWWLVLSYPRFDTMIAQNVYLPGRKKSLAYLASWYADHYVFWKDEGRDWNRRMPEDQLWHYNTLDCTYTYEATIALEEHVRVARLEEQLRFQMALFPPALRMMLRGVAVNTRSREALMQGIESALAKQESRRVCLLGHPINPRSPKQLATLFYHDFDIPPIRSRTTGSPTTGKEALARIALKQPLLKPVIDTIERTRTLGIYKSNFVDAAGPPDRLYTSFNIAGTKTYRFSSSSNPFGWGTDLQNVPKYEEDDPKRSDLPDIRKMFQPDPGWTLVDIDYSKADLHVVVWEADDKELKQMLREGLNVYREATKLIKMPYGKAKRFIHGTDYGAQPRTMAIKLGITVREAESAQHLWFSAHPGIKAWHQRVERALQETHTIANRFGFRRIFFGRFEDNYKEALAWVPQSTVAHCVNTLLLRVDRILPHQVQVLLQVHDSLLTQVRNRKVITQMQLLSRVIIPYPEPLIIPAEAKISKVSWGDLAKIQ